MNPAATSLHIAGLVRMSTCDWPGQLAATVFCQGCSWDCPYCHNPGLRPSRGEEHVEWSTVFDFLKSRAGLLDAVVFSGGEPTLQPSLPAAIEEVKRMGFRIGLHTAGVAPNRLAPLLPWLDWVGFDIKAPFDDYARITGAARSGEQALASLRLLLASGIDFEARTTVHPGLLSAEDLAAIKRNLLALGVRRYVLQRFRPDGVPPNRLLQFPKPAPQPLPADYAQGFASFQLR